MKVAFCSDLHLEMSDANFEFPDADVMLLAGDICSISDLRESFCGTKAGMNYREFFKNVSAKYKQVIYIPGNHDHWDAGFTDIDKLFNQFSLEEGINNITFNYKGVLNIGDVRFVYATLWTDYNQNDHLVKLSALRWMNDYDRIDIRENELRKLHPDDVYAVHKDHREHILNNIQGHDKVVVMTHHAPNLKSLYDVNSDLAYFYACTDMDAVFFAPGVKYYIHGHTHEESDYVLGDTRVMTNCRGYYENDFAVKVFEI